MTSKGMVAVIRYVPDLAKGESVNVGLVWQYRGETRVRLREDWTKVRLLDPQVDLEVIAKAARGIEHMIQTMGDLDESLAEEFSKSNVRLGRVSPIPVEEDQALEGLDLIFDRLVEERAASRRDLSKDTLQILEGIIDNLAISDSLERGDIESAKATFAGVPIEEAKLESYLGVLGGSKNEKDWEQALGIMKERGLRSPSLHALFAYRWWSIGKFDLAIRTAEEGLKKAAETEGNLERPYRLKNSLAYYYADSGKAEYKSKALQLAREALEARPDDPAVVDTQGYVQIVYGDSKEEIMEGVELCVRAWKDGNGPLSYLAKHVGAAHQRLRQFGGN